MVKNRELEEISQNTHLPIVEPCQRTHPHGRDKENREYRSQGRATLPGLGKNKESKTSEQGNQGGRPIILLAQNPQTEEKSREHQDPSPKGFEIDHKRRCARQQHQQARG